MGQISVNLALPPATPGSLSLGLRQSSSIPRAQSPGEEPLNSVSLAFVRDGRHRLSLPCRIELCALRIAGLKEIAGVMAG